MAGDRAANLLRAISAIFRGDMHLNSASSIYEIFNEAGESVALTLVIALTAERLEPFSLKKYCQSTEDRISHKALIERGELAHHELSACARSCSIDSKGRPIANPWA